ncbi:hypothetical protein ABIE26_001191 [Pedobacter africanus]|uniref:Uncharacterized protein n=1 Tax=Pedobacter africanus TaxID=151894 RepID=A0ACC6KSZ2_9SPHI|nr:RagB/SusD family nutrient uptake outer membrane protein [Pedobacter africanus]MDR6782321.1 hypothetical protein [Pedobacter africanus]
MKLIYFIILIIVFSSISCKKALDLNPKNSITYSNGIRTEKDIESLMNSAELNVRLVENLLLTNYDSFFQSFYNRYSTNYINLFDFLKGSHYPNDKASLGFYQIIHKSNIPLRYLDQTDMPEPRKDYYRGRANFYKAFAYLWLIRRYGDVILIKDDVILEPVAKSPWPEVADYAIDLAEQAVKLLPEYSDIKDAQGNPPANKFTPSKGAANALLANLTAWKAGAKYLAQVKDANYDELSLWKKSADACSQIIESGQYNLAPNPEQVCESVLVGNSSESIYEAELRQYWDELNIYSLKYNQREYHGLNVYSQNDCPINFKNMVPPEYLDLKLLADSVKRLFSSEDLRLKSWFYKFDSLSNVPSMKGLAFSNKYRRFKYYTSGTKLGLVQGCFQNRVFWRLADIYLLRAESRARLGDMGGAIADLNKVRARSQAKLYENSDGDLRYAIYEEKVKKEMLFEPDSFWYDVIRNGYLRIEPSLKQFSTDKLTDQDLRDGAAFVNMEADPNNPLMRHNIYWQRRFGQ